MSKGQTMQLMFLKLDGVRGSSYAPRHIGEIEIEGFTWETGANSAPGNVGPVRTSHKDLKIFKSQDLVSALLQVAAAEGRHFKNALLTVETVTLKGGLLRTAVVRMNSVLIHSVTQLNGPYFSGPGEGLEEIVLNFSGMHIDQF